MIRYLGKKWHRTIHDITPQGVHGRLACGRSRLGATDMRLLSEVAPRGPLPHLLA